MTFTNEDCMELMSRYPDRHFDLAIVDPPYFRGPETGEYYKTTSKKAACKSREYKKIKSWDIPNQSYFNELLRISKNKIIWGINYYDINYMGPGRIIWDKKNDDSSFSKCEIASCSLISTVQIFRYKWNGMLQENMKTKELHSHPTHKPIALYKWLLTKYAKPGQLILDTHVGSASSLIACEDLGFDYVGCELDMDYYRSACERIENYRAQPKLISNTEQFEQNSLDI